MLVQPVAMVCDLSPCYKVSRTDFRYETRRCTQFSIVNDTSNISTSMSRRRICFYTFQKDNRPNWVKLPFSQQTHHAHMAWITITYGEHIERHNFFHTHTHTHTHKGRKPPFQISRASKLRVKFVVYEVERLSQLRQMCTCVAAQTRVVCATLVRKVL